MEEELESTSSSDEEIIEEEHDSRDSLEAPSAVTHNRKVQFRPKDVIVLEFDGAEKQRRPGSGRLLSAARRGDPESHGALREERRPTPRERPNSGSQRAQPPPPQTTSAPGGTRVMGGGGTGKNSKGILANKKPTPVRDQARSDVLMKPGIAIIAIEYRYMYSMPDKRGQLE